MDTLEGQLKCPVCQEIPSAKIFHCKNGHTICYSCLSSTKSCPSCNASLIGDENRVRQIALEGVLDLLNFPCPNKSLGCSQMLKRTKLKTHLKRECSFGGIKIDLCNQVGLASCQFQCDSKRIEAILEHFEKNHEATIIQSSSATIRYTKFEHLMATLNAPRYIGPPLIIKRVGHEITTSFLIFPMFSLVNKQDKLKMCSWLCVLLEENAPDERQFSITITIKSPKVKMASLKWTTVAYSLEECGPFLKTPPYLLPSSLLQENYLENGDLLLEMRIHQEAVGPIKSKQVFKSATESAIVSLGMSHKKVTRTGGIVVPAKQLYLTPDANTDETSIDPKISFLGPWQKISSTEEIFETLATYVQNSSTSLPGVVVQVENMLKTRSSNSDVLNSSKTWTLLWLTTTYESLQLLKNPSGLKENILFHDRVAGALEQYMNAIKKSCGQIVLLCWVALGRMYESHLGYEELSKSPLPRGFNSVKGNGRMAPNPKEHNVINNMIIPWGKVNQEVNEGLSLKYNEYIVNDLDNVKVHYAVHLKISQLNS